MNNLLSYCWLVEARISAFEKDLPVQKKIIPIKEIVSSYCAYIFIIGLLPSTQSTQACKKFSARVKALLGIPKRAS